MVTLKVLLGRLMIFSRQIAAVNEEIVKVRAMGDSPNDLMDRRDLLVEKLSGLINITTDQRDPDDLVVHTDGIELVQERPSGPLNLPAVSKTMDTAALSGPIPALPPISPAVHWELSSSSATATCGMKYRNWIP